MQRESDEWAMGALAGVKVLDFSWVIVGPLGTRLLAEHGATVVRVESAQRLDVARTYVPYVNGPGVNRCAFFAAYNNDKLDIALNLNHPRARPVVERLVGWADLVVENFMPGTLERWRLGYDDLRAINPAVILLRTSLFGQTGPYARQPGFGTTMQALAGFTPLVSWPDRAPVGTPTPYTDFIAPWFLVTLAMAALDHRRQTGEGQCLDLSQMEAGLQFTIPVLLDGAVHGRVAPAAGNRHPAAAPHGVFRCRGEDRWCAIAVAGDAPWQGLCRAMGEPPWSRDPRFATLLGRQQHEDELEARLEEWTAALPPETVMALLQAEGVPAGLVANGQDLHEDPQLAHRGHFVRLRHPEMGETAYDAPSFRLSATPAQLRRAAPCLGEHTELVCRELLGMSDEEFIALLADGVFE